MDIPSAQIPSENLPECWHNDTRMNALFAPFRIKSSNPESWDMKMKFWSEMLKVWCRFKGDPIVSAADGRLAFQRRGRNPACLDIVIEEGYKKGELSPVTKYQQILHNGPEGWLKWGTKVAFKPAVFVITAVSYFMPSRQNLDSDGLPKASIDGTQRFVLESAVQDQAMKLLQNYPPGLERVGTIDDLLINTNFDTNKKDSFEILLGYLVSQGLAIKKGDVVKLAEQSSRVSQISESDEAIVRLVSSERRLEADAARHTREAQLANSEAKVALSVGNRLAAKNHLRRKHKFVERAEKSEMALENVRQLLMSMREMEVNMAVVDTYKSGTQAMKREMDTHGLNESNVHDTMDDLKEVLESYSEVEKALSAVSDESDAADLERELMELMDEDGKGGGSPQGQIKKVAKKAPVLPSPPRFEPRSPEKEFVYDGEEQMLDELNKLSDTDSAVKVKRRAVAVGEEIQPTTSKTWSAKSKEKSPPKLSIDDLCTSFEELRTDDRLHPGQKLDVKTSSPTTLYHNEFQVNDHKYDERVWLYNAGDKSRTYSDGLASSTEYFSVESPGKGPSSFQMAPGGERRCSKQIDTQEDDIQRRLDNLRKS